MNKNIVSAAICAALISTAATAGTQPAASQQQQARDPSGLFDKGHLGSSDYFTGTSHVTSLLVRAGIDNIANVAYQARSRTYWHTHQVGQVLIVTEGQGFYQERGKPAQLIRKGDVINIPADVEHWHGATATTGMTHIAITNFAGNELVTWQEEVSDEEFARVNQAAGLTATSNKER